MGKDQGLCITVPSQFRCPISLDVMKSPVSLSTGVTYDRSSIQRWLDSGHTTCPATMQILSTTDFVPNLTLRRLIHLWSSSSNSHNPDPSLSNSEASSLLHHLLSSPDDVSGFLKLLRFASLSPDNTRLLSRNDAFVELLVRITTRQEHLDLVDTAFKILRLISRSSDDKSNLRTAFLRSETLASAGRVLRFGSRDSKIAVADLIETLASDSDSQSKITVLDNESILTGLISGINPSKSGVDLTESYLSCIISLSSPKRNKQRLVRGALVREIGRVLCRRETGLAAAEKAMKLLELMMGCSEGREAICEDRECVAAVVGRLLRGSAAGSESGVAVLWSVCCWVRDERAREALAASPNGFARILLVMQTGCSPPAKRMCADLLRVFSVSSKAGLGTYDTKTIHIMPF